ncbi:MAG: hypothetical protein WBZ20_15215 [Nitrososphaeraceae archaeon]
MHTGSTRTVPTVPSKPGSSNCLTHFSATAALRMNGATITISNANRPAIIRLATI